MDRETIENFEKNHGYILPESYIKLLLVCNNEPENYCMNPGDINLLPLEELPNMREMHEMDKYCPEYIAIGDGGGGEVLIMKQERECNTLIVTSAENLISQFITPEYCTFFYDFFNEWVNRRCPVHEIDSMYGE